jgi:hypothetical protein
MKDLRPQPRPTLILDEIPPNFPPRQMTQQHPIGWLAEMAAPAREAPQLAATAPSANPVQT